MTEDPFGNLRDWGPVLERLEELAAAGRLHQFQAGLIRILRFRGNWRLREAVLKHLEGVSRPSEALIAEVVRLVADDNTYYEARIMAAKALVAMMRDEKGKKTESQPVQARAVADRIRHLRQIPQPPLFSQVLDRCLAELA